MTSVHKAKPGKLDIKRHEPGIPTLVFKTYEVRTIIYQA